ncbi:hypothetical protein H8K33_17340 [Undibacterium amnicola]|uniref:DUF4760 domain-containing protein n=1 Tax=Undibacterium amnicola TaxID=1834038 RepID=A0ABR6XUW4_9BURK|nr:hypothetical protein [Undibacterium amnicola]MBC3833278.1 hypothetical protein [Undibacterium amnicola]
MPLTDLLSIAGSVLIAIGGGAAIVFALAKWLGGVWATRILENERATQSREQELLVRRRNIYAKLSVALRVFLSSTTRSSPEYQVRFLEAYDEAALWASDEVMNAVGMLLDQIRSNTERRGAHSEQELQTAYATCITSMRKDVGFKNTEFSYRVVSF